MMIKRTNYFCNNYHYAIIRKFAQNSVTTIYNQSKEVVADGANEINKKVKTIIGVQPIKKVIETGSELSEKSKEFIKSTYENQKDKLEKLNLPELPDQKRSAIVLNSFMDKVKNGFNISLNVGRIVKDSNEFQTTKNLNIQAIKSLLPLGKKIVHEVREATKK